MVEEQTTELRGRMKCEVSGYTATRGAMWERLREAGEAHDQRWDALSRSPFWRG